MACQKVYKQGRDDSKGSISRSGAEEPGNEASLCVNTDRAFLVWERDRMCIRKWRPMQRAVVGQCCEQLF